MWTSYVRYEVKQRRRTARSAERLTERPRQSRCQGWRAFRSNWSREMLRALEKARQLQQA